MKINSRFEMFVLLFGGALLLLHGVPAGIQAFEYLVTHDIATAYRVGYATGRLLAPLCFLGAGAGLLWLAWAKRARHGSSTPGP